MSVTYQPFREPAVPHASAAQVLCQSNLNALGADSGEFSNAASVSSRLFFVYLPKYNQKLYKYNWKATEELMKYACVHINYLPLLA